MPGELVYTNWPDDFLWGANAIQEARYAIGAVYALQIYEWFTGLEKEIRLVYHAKWNSVKVAYLLCRYYPLLLWPVVMWAYLLDHPEALCARSGKPIHVLLAPCQFFPQAVMFMRAYAFSGRSSTVLAILSMCYVALVGVDLWAFCIGVKMPPKLFYWAFGGESGCFPDYGSDVMGLRIGFSMLAAVLMDLVSLVTVLIYCKRESDHRGGSLTRYFIKQGLSSFVTVTVVNAAAAITFFKPPSYHTGVGLPLILVVPNLVACRVILQLRRKVSPTETELWREHSMLVNEALATTERDMWLMDSEEDLPSSHTHTLRTLPK
ncbi:hypothetical protein CC1G_00767 [Coprinopsis cinerea okayama7|uniref:DUF6533 domain-containing protein n=1 Tax=Coprinopsis cinerea (strain Okayama-7 / 130 / ATCC MYA-4618 / FGSC 9003) TaxID=240176 RepID=A8N8P2_COPC7|nr:hypothetical protein CC1G_00767 [Coprinopsis cinerea okayama7\|eukprot:XP_001831220.1 hypothetical protein CC1G_00767 [Coprinopsis cinerea okayama7\